MTSRPDLLPRAVKPPTSGPATAGGGRGRAKPVERERLIHLAILDWLRSVLPGALIHHSAAELGLQGPAVARAIAKAKHMGMLVGFPDFLVLSGGVFVALEVKAPGGYATDAQKAVGKVIEANGGHWFVVRSIADAREALRDAGVTTREVMGA